jgi:hypothetical protein
MALNLIWILVASIIGFALAFTFAGLLKLERNIYLLFYIPVSIGLFCAFMISNQISVVETITHNLLPGLAGAVVAAGFVIKNVVSQPSSERNKGLALLTDIIWPGFAYGLTDALLLSVLPILAIKSMFAGTELSTAGKVGFGVAAFTASLFITVIYHLGYPEFRGKKIIWPAIGNGVLSLAFILTMNPLAAILPHIGMHIAAMLHGRETTGQVPPHYEGVRSEG